MEISDENIFIVSTCKEKGLAFLKGEGEIGVRKIEQKEPTPAVGAGPASYTVTVNGKAYALSIDGNQAVVNGKAFQVDLQAGGGETVSALTPVAGSGTEVVTEMPGKVLRLLANVGDMVETAQPLLVLEAMKMEVPINAPMAGTVNDFMVKPGQQVAAGEVLAHIS